MSFLDMYRQRAVTTRNDMARLQKQKADEATKHADARKRANEAEAAASRSQSSSTADSKRREAERYRGDAVESESRIISSIVNVRSQTMSGPASE